MKATSAQERMDTLTEVAEMARDTLEEWMRRWVADNGQPMRACWQDDGTAVIEIDDTPVMRVQVEIGVSAVEYEGGAGA